MIFERYFFIPKKERFASPDAYPYRYTSIEIPRGRRGGSLHAWRFYPPEGLLDTKLSDVMVIHLHGNYGNISNHFTGAAWMSRLGCRVLVFDYSGYGESSGKASPAQARQDVLDVWRWCLKRYSRRRFIFFGQSLGGFLLLNALPDLYPRKRIAGVIVEGAFPTFSGMVEHYASQIPLVGKFSRAISGLVDSRLSAVIPASGRYPWPFLHIHGTNDEVVPYEQGKLLFDLSPAANKTWWEVPGGRHLDTFIDYGFTYRNKLGLFLEGISGGPVAASKKYQLFK